MSQPSLPAPSVNLVFTNTVVPVTASRMLTFLGLGSWLGVAALLRWSCSRGEIWLDEVWTWDISHQLTWPGGLFYQLREENNHYLNTLIVWWLKDQPAVWFRLPAVLFGVASVRVAWSLGRANPHRGELTGWLAAGLTATSYLMVHYSSEARGYAYAVFFAALAYHQLLVLETCRQRGSDLSPRESRISRTSTWLFPLACCGGFLSQPIFLTCFGAMVVWIFLRLRRQVPEESEWPTLLRYFFCPGAFFVVLYLVDLRYAVNGGGDQYPLWRVVMETLSLIGGGPFAGWGAAVVAGLVLGAFGQGLRVLARANDDRWIFYVLVVVVMPLGLLVVLRRAEVYPRYFLIAVFFLIQAAAVGLADLLRRGTVARLVAVVSLVTVMWGNGQHLRRLADLGRGGYLPILESIPFQEPLPVIHLRTDNPFRHPLMFKYLLPEADLQGKTLDVVTPDRVPTAGTEWILTHNLDVYWQPPQTLTTQEIAYDLRVFRPYAGLSGWGLALYRRRDPDPAKPPPIDPP